jgi:hypothetical protein
MNDDLQTALYHLRKAAVHDASYLLFERDYSEWHRRQVASGVARACVNLLEEHVERKVSVGQSDELWLSDLRLRRNRGPLVSLDSRQDSSPNVSDLRAGDNSA